ncbi:tyrosine protein phosphatase non receptor type [Trichuris trichiura]|uniref:protein-tyrosine-phosphatase n=1 Tax=Trichuris trichiura TaxID=36087 RepID=A0A077YYJ1_TRITR|nr:tyrosine protein phosphatase non receptor type [Trichuris trichiura]
MAAKDSKGKVSLIDCNILIPNASSYEDEGSVFQRSSAAPILTFVRKMKRRGIDHLLRQFDDMCERELDPSNTLPTKAFQENPSLNRYRNVYLYDASRVVLNDKLGPDYIHASFVDGYKHKNAYIGPTKNTLVDFWRMVWQEKCVLVVMVTTFVEDGREKCEVYFPTSSDEDLLFGVFKVSLKQVERQSTCEVLLFSIVCTLTEESREIMLLIYLDWPDSKIPTKPEKIFDFVSLVRSAQMTMLKRVFPNWAGHPRGPPIVVHCSAGVGRSASFVLIDICLEMLDDSGCVNVVSILRKVRLQRRHAVANPLQFLFIYFVVLHKIRASKFFHAKVSR